MPESAKGFGAGKVILLGEHAVVHGVPAIAASLRRGVTATARPNGKDSLHVVPWGRSVRPDAEGDDPLERAFADALASYPTRPPLRVEARVELPPGAGLGCSAALGVSLLDALDRALGVERTREGLARRALEWERFFHGDPSGIDNAVAALGGFIRFERKHGMSRLEVPTPLHLVLVHSGQRSETKDMVARVATRLVEEPVPTRKRFDEIGALVRQAEGAILRGDLTALGRHLDRNHHALFELGLSTPGIEELRRRAKSVGALGAKVTGAGGGGCMIALAEDAHHAASIAAAIGAEAIVEEVGCAA